MKAFLTHFIAFAFSLLILSLSERAHAQSADCRDIIGDTIQFENRTTTMKAEGKDKLAQLGQQMRGNNCKVIILGNGGGGKYNEIRVNKVVDYMATNYGIERDRFVVTYIGSARRYTVIYTIAELK